MSATLKEEDEGKVANSVEMGATVAMKAISRSGPLCGEVLNEECGASILTSLQSSCTACI